MRILEEFWYGNIEPTEYDTSSCKEYKKLQELICRNEEKLRAIMTDEQKELFEKYTDCVHEFQTITDCLDLSEQLQAGGQNDAGSHGRITEHSVAPIGQAMTDGRFFRFIRKKVTITQKRR